MATIPINRFRVIAKTLVSGSNIIYQENIDVAVIILSAAVTNITGSLQRVSVTLVKSGSLEPTYLLYNTPIPTGEALNPFPGKVILEKNDALLMSTTQSGSLDVVMSILENATD